jgi:hypothetical protein
MGMTAQQLKDQADLLLNAINSDPLNGTTLGTFAEVMGFNAAQNIL